MVTVVTLQNGVQAETDVLNQTEGDARYVGIANTQTITGAKTFTAPTVVSVNNTAPALRVTQVGAGDALLVEDSANPDASPFRIDNAGNLITANNITADGVTSVKNLVYQSPNVNGAVGSPVRRIVGGYSQNTVANTLYEIGRFVFNGDAQTLSSKIKIQAMTGATARYFDINLQLRTNGNADMGVRYTISQDEFDAATLNLASIEIYFLPFNAVGPVVSRTAVICLRAGNTNLQNINWLFDIFERNPYNNFTQTESLTVFDPAGFSLVSPFVDPTGLTFSQFLTAPKFTGPLVGNADTASKLLTPRTISLDGDVIGSASFDGSQNITITTVASGATQTQLNIDNGNASTVFQDYVLRLDFGKNGANINPTGTP